ncbi:MAG: hypothetical protein ACOCYE_02630, partial [Pseudomonadota bacterium]
SDLTEDRRSYTTSRGTTVLGACEPQPRDSAAWMPPPPPGFQAHLDRLDVPLDLPTAGKAIVVNVPAFELIAFEDGEPVLRSRVISVRLGTRRRSCARPPRPCASARRGARRRA